MKYKLIVDYEKPYEIICNSKKDLDKELNYIETEVTLNEYAYCNIIILNNKDIDITKEVLK